MARPGITASRHADRQTAEIQIGVAIMNRYNTLGTAEITAEITAGHCQLIWRSASSAGSANIRRSSQGRSGATGHGHRTWHGDRSWRKVDSGGGGKEC